MLENIQEAQAAARLMGSEFLTSAPRFNNNCQILKALN